MIMTSINDQVTFWFYNFLFLLSFLSWDICFLKFYFLLLIGYSLCEREGALVTVLMPPDVIACVSCNIIFELKVYLMSPSSLHIVRNSGRNNLRLSITLSFPGRKTSVYITTTKRVRFLIQQPHLGSKIRRLISTIRVGFGCPCRFLVHLFGWDPPGYK